MKCGLGGDAFVVLHDAKKREMVAFNGSGVAGSGATADYYRSRGHKSMPLKGVHSVSVPGAVSVYEAVLETLLHDALGRAMGPAIRLAEEGLAITAYISARYQDEAETLARYPHSAAQYLPKGRRARAG
jgi:gamma-glutamyltranspeptidase/glutathione hydrolase